MWTYRHKHFDVYQLPALSDNYIYLIAPHNSRLLAAVDPAEEAPVVEACRRLGRPLTHIFNTHHHRDHTGANATLKQAFGCRIAGHREDRERLPELDDALAADTTWPWAGLDVGILDMPGHTLGHIAWLIGDALFCGDTLFGAGCGRLFEGTPQQMWQSLSRLAALPDDTSVYCAHEYTLANLDFARSVDADNPSLARRIEADTQKRRHGEPTIPSRIGLEKETNPFLRPLQAAFRARYAVSCGIDSDPLSVFTHLRAARDDWR